MLHTLDQLDRALFLWLNGFHEPSVDVAMRLITATAPWIPLYGLIVAWLIWRWGRHSVGALVVIALAITAADQFASSLVKPLVGRLRPCHDALISTQVHTIAGCGGQYGFISSHAANTFALAMLVFLLSRPFPEHRLLGWAMFAWAGLVTYSRIYAGVHYPTDVLCGALAGICIVRLLSFGASKLNLRPFCPALLPL